MSIKQALESTKDLTHSEKAMLAHCLISSLESVHETCVDETWGELAAKRFRELESGKVESVSWDELKRDIRD